MELATYGNDTGNASNTKTRYEYNKDYQVTKAVQYNGSAVVEEDNYIYPTNNSKQLQNFTKNMDYDATTNKYKTVISEDYLYDFAARIQSVKTADSTKVYGYDGAGNRKSEVTTKGTTNTAIDYKYNYNNRLASVNGVALSYDANGNLLTSNDGKEQYGYDLFNRQISAVDKSDSGLVKSAQYTYNGENQRLSKKVNSDETTLYSYDGSKLSEEIDGNTYKIKARNIYGNAKPIERMEIDTKKDYNLLYDGLGSLALTDNQKNYGRYSYDVFGNIKSKPTDINNTFAYKGYVYDNETNNYYLNARYYDPSTARFTQEDTYFGDMSDPQTLNKYVYCINDPLSYEDPTGHTPKYMFQNMTGAGYENVMGHGSEDNNNNSDDSDKSKDPGDTELNKKDNHDESLISGSDNSDGMVRSDQRQIMFKYWQHNYPNSIKYPTATEILAVAGTSGDSFICSTCTYRSSC